MAVDEDDLRNRVKLVINQQPAQPLPASPVTVDPTAMRRAVRDSVSIQSPEQNARVSILARDTGLPRNAVSENLDRVEKERQRRLIEERLAYEAPRVGELLQDQDFAGAAQGNEQELIDTEVRASINSSNEWVINPFKALFLAEYLKSKLLGGAIDGSGAMDLAAQKVIMERENLEFAPVFEGAIGHIQTGLQQTGDFLVGAAADAGMAGFVSSPLAPGITAQLPMDVSEEIVQGVRGWQKERADERAFVSDVREQAVFDKYGPLADWQVAGRSAVQSLLRQAPGTILALVRPELRYIGLGYMGLQSTASKFDELLAADKGRGVAYMGGAWEGITEIATEVAPLRVLSKFKYAPKGALGRIGIKLFGAEIFGENVATILQTFGDYHTGLDEQMIELIEQDKRWEAFQMQLHRQWITSLSTVMMVGVHGSAGYAVNKVHRKWQDRNFKSMSGNKRLQYLISSSIESEIRGIAPDQWRKLAQKLVVDAGDMANVYITYDEAAEWLKNAYISRAQGEDDDPFLDRMRDELASKSETKADVMFDAADFAAFGPSHDTFKSLLAHVKIDPEGDTGAELLEKKAQSLMDYVRGELLKESETNESLTDLVERVRAELLEQGRWKDDPEGAEVAELSAQIVPAALKALAELQGIDPEVLLRLLSPHVVGIDDAPGGETLDQVIDFLEIKRKKQGAIFDAKMQERADLETEQLAIEDAIKNLTTASGIEGEPAAEFDVTDDTALENHLQALIFADRGLNIELGYNPATKSAMSATETPATAKGLVAQLRALESRLVDISEILPGVEQEIDSAREAYDATGLNKIAERLKSTTLFQDKDKSLGTGTTQLKVHAQNIAKLQVRNYGGHREAPLIGTKELLQNAFDAIKDVFFLQQTQGDMFAGSYKPVIELAFQTENRRIIVRDNGIGMDEATLTGAMLTLGESKKLNPDASGGFGLAKISFLINAEEVTITTVKDGIKTVLTASGADIFESLDGTPETALKYERFETSDPAGTTIDVTFPEQYLNPQTRQLEALPFPERWDFSSMLENSPLFHDIEVRYYPDMSDVNLTRFMARDPETYLSPLQPETGANFPIDQYATWANINFPWGTARILVSREQTSFGKMHVLSNGIWQFDVEIPKSLLDPWSGAVPYTFFMDVVPSPDVSADDLAYPFVDNRTGFTPAATSHLAVIVQQLSLAYATRQMVDETLGFGEIEYYNDDGTISERISLIPNMTIEDFASALNPEAGVQLTVDANGRVTRDDGEVIEELSEADIRAYQPDLTDFNIPQEDVDPKRIIVHNNMRFAAAEDGEVGAVQGRDFIDVLREQFPGRGDEYLRMVGDFFMQLRDSTAVMKIPGFEVAELGGITVNLADVPVGISFDREYFGVHIPKPFRGMFINPGIAEPDYLQHEQIPEGARPAVLAMHIVGTMIHELAHFEQMNHRGDFIKAMQKLTAYLQLNPNFLNSRDKFIADFTEYYDVYTWINEQYGLPSDALANIGTRLKGAGQLIGSEGRAGLVGTGLAAIGVAKEGKEGERDGGERQISLITDEGSASPAHLKTTETLSVNPVPEVTSADTPQADLFEGVTNEPRFVDTPEGGELGDAVELGTETPTGEENPSTESRTETNQPLDEELTRQVGETIVQDFIAPQRKVLAANLPGTEVVKDLRARLSEEQLAARDAALAQGDLDGSAKSKQRFQEGFVGGYLGHGPYINPWKQAGYDAGKKFAQSQEGRQLKRDMKATTAPARATVESWVKEARRIGIEEDNSDKTIVSLFDFTGQWSQPWVDAGYHVINMDIKLGNNLLDMEYLFEITEKLKAYNVVGILAAPPCDTFTNSGRQHWSKRHDIKSVEDVRRMFGEWAALWYERPTDVGTLLLESVGYLTRNLDPEFYAMENPIGRIPKITGLPGPSFQFDPYIFGDSYSKATQMWGVFNTDMPTAPTYPIQGSMAFRTFGGGDGKAARSITPRGFAYSFFMAQHKAGEQRSEPLTADELVVQEAFNHSEYRLYVNLYDRFMRTFSSPNFAWAMDQDVMTHYGYPAQNDKNVVMTHMAMLNDYAAELLAAREAAQKAIGAALWEEVGEDHYEAELREMTDWWLSPSETAALWAYMEATAPEAATPDDAASATGIMGLSAIQDVFERMQESLSWPAVQKGQPELAEQIAEAIILTRNEYKLHVPPELVEQAIENTNYNDFAAALAENAEDVLIDGLGLTPREFWGNIHKGNMGHVRSIAMPSSQRSAMARTEPVYQTEDTAGPQGDPTQETLFQPEPFEPLGIEGLTGQGIEPSDPEWIKHATRNELRARAPAELVDAAVSHETSGKFIEWMDENMYSARLVEELFGITRHQLWRAAKNGDADLINLLYRDTRRREMAVEAGYPMVVLPKNLEEGQQTLFQSADNFDDALNMLELGEINQDVYDQLIRDPGNAEFADIWEQAEALRQDQSGKRGSITWDREAGKAYIRMLQARDKSSFLHEGGHWYLELVRILAATQPDLKPEFQAQIDSILKFLKINSLDEITDQHHEKFADTFEIYLREGKAPSHGLRRAFQAFAKWLTVIYEHMGGGKLDAETRGMFDRMLATKAEIEAVNLESRFDDALESARAAGFTEEELQDFIKTMKYADGDQREKLRVKLLRQYQRRFKDWWRVDEDRERKVAYEFLENQPIYELIQYLSKKDNRLDRDTVFALMRWGVPPKQKEPESALQFIASHGGIDRLAAASDGVDRGHWLNTTTYKMRYKRVPKDGGGWRRVQTGYGNVSVKNPDNYPLGTGPGKPQLFPATGGMSLDGMGELLAEAGFMDGFTYGHWAELKPGQQGTTASERHMLWYESDVIAILQDSFRGQTVFRAGAAGAAGTLLAEEFGELEREARIRDMEAATPEERALMEADAPPPEQEWQPMPRKFYGKTAEGGQNPEVIAGQFGFDSAVEMITSVLNVTPISKAMIDMAEQAMILRHGDILTDGTIEIEALVAAHNEQRGKMILKMMKKLAADTNTRSIASRIAKAEAKSEIDGMKMSEIRLASLWKAELKAAEEVGKLLAEGDKEGALAAAERQYKAHLRWKAAEQSQRKIKAIRKKFKRYKKPKYSKGLLNPDHRGALKAIAESLEFERNNVKERDEAFNARQLVARFITDYNNDPDSFKLIVGHSKDVEGNDQVSDVLNKADELHELTVAEIIELGDIAKSIDAAGKAETKEKRDAFNLEMDNLAGGAWGGELPPWASSDDPWAATSGFVRMIMASHRKLGSLLKKADGHEDMGPMVRAVEIPLLDAAKQEMVLNRDFFDASREIFKDDASIFHFAHDIQKFTLESGQTVRLSLGTRIMIALNFGNGGNRDALSNMTRFELTPADVGRIINTLDGHQWDIVEAMWAQIGSYRKQVGDLEVSMRGVEPKWVEALPFELESGRIISGGYFPLISDRRLNFFGRGRSQDLELRAANSASGGTTTAFTLHHHTKARTGFAGHTIDLNIAAYFRHMSMVMHDLAYREPINTVSRIVNHPKIREALIKSLGDEGYQALLGRIKETGAGHIHPTELQWLERTLRHARMGITLGALGFSNKTMISQTFGMAVAIAELGEETMRRGTADFMSNPIANTEFIRRVDITMRHRAEHLNRDAAAVHRQLKGITKLEGIQAASFIPLLMADYMVSLPTWWSAYLKGLDHVADPSNKNFLSEQDAINYAGRVVYRTQQSGLLMDLSAVETQNELMRFLTMMYSAFNAIFQITSESVEKYQMGKDSAGRLAMNIFWMYAVVGILDWLLFGDDFDEDDDWLFNPVTEAIAGLAAGTMIGLREMSFYFATGRVGETPLTTMIKTVPELTKQALIQPLTGEEQGWDQATLRAFNKFASIVLHWPAMSGQLNRTEQYLIDYYQGEIDEFSLYDALVTGRDRSSDDKVRRQGRPERGGRGERRGRAERSGR